MNDLQRTDGWLAARVGKLTASRLADALATTRSGWGASRANYMAQLIAERLTGAPASRYVNAEMQWGIDTEADAIAAYEFQYDVDVEPVGFVEHPDIPMSGASPDGLIADDGLLEVKCPNTATHIEFLLTESVPDKYVKQMAWQMACTGRHWTDYASFDPRMPPEMQLRVRRFQRDDKRVAEHEQQVRDFLAELDAKLDALKAQYGELRAA